MKTLMNYATLLTLTVAISQIVACGQGNNKKLKITGKRARQAVADFKNGADTKNLALAKVKQPEDLKVLKKTIKEGDTEVHRIMISKGKEKDSLKSIEVNITCVRDLEAASRLGLARSGLFILKGSTVRVVRNINDEVKTSKSKKAQQAKTTTSTSLEPVLEVTCASDKEEDVSVFTAKSKDEAEALQKIYTLLDLTKVNEETEAVALIQRDSKARHSAQFTCSGDLDETKGLILETQAYGILVADGSEVASVTRTSEVITAEARAQNQKVSKDTETSLALTYMHCGTKITRLPVKTEAEKEAEAKEAAEKTAEKTDETKTTETNEKVAATEKTTETVENTDEKKTETKVTVEEK